MSNIDRWMENRRQSINAVDQRADISHKGNIGTAEEQLASKDEEIRRLKKELALKDEKMQLFEQQLKVIKSACTNIDTAVKSAENAFTIAPPRTNTLVGKLFQEKDLSGAVPSANMEVNV